MPEYTKLGILLSSNKNILVAKVDGNANTLPQFEIDGFPAIFFLKRNGK
jgi:hypothetical protein